MRVTVAKTNFKSTKASEVTHLKKRLKKLFEMQQNQVGSATTFNGTEKSRVPDHKAPTQKPVRKNVYEGTAKNIRLKQFTNNLKAKKARKSIGAAKNVRMGQKPMRKNANECTANNVSPNELSNNLKIRKATKTKGAAEGVHPKETTKSAAITCSKPKEEQQQSKENIAVKVSKAIAENGSKKVRVKRYKTALPQSEVSKNLSNKAQQETMSCKSVPPHPSKASAKAKKRHPCAETANSPRNKKRRKQPQRRVNFAKPKDEVDLSCRTDSSYNFKVISGIMPSGNLGCDDRSDNEAMSVQNGVERGEYYSDDDSESEEETDFDSSDYDEEEEEKKEYTDDEDSYCFESVTDDEDYKLPENVPEDLIIPKGTATKRPLQTEDNVEFDSDDGEAQIVEIYKEETVSIQQPQGCDRDELLRLCLQKISLRCAAHETPPDRDEEDELEMASNNSDCPHLVPIIDEEGFQMYNPGMDYSDLEEGSCKEMSDSFGSSYEECTDSSSVCSVDVNSKYMMAAESSDKEGHLPQCRTSKMHADVISAANFKYAEVNDPLICANVSETLLEEPQHPWIKVVGNFVAAGEGEVVSTIVMKDLDETADVTAAAEDDTTYAVIQEEQRKELSTVAMATASPLHQPTLARVSQSTQPSRSIFYNAIDANFVLVLLKDPFYIYGTVRLTLLAGSIDVYGHSPIVGDVLEIFSPRGCSIVQVRTTTQAPATKQQVELALRQLETNFIRTDLLSILEHFSPATDAVLLLQRNAARKKCVNNFKKYMNENVFPNMNSVHMERPYYASESLLRCIINTDANDKVLRCPPQWSALFLQKHSRMLLVGGKSVGKSTLLRFLVNRHLHQHKRILLIDLDIGQPELFVPQTISCFVLTQPLLGPGFFLNRQPAKAYMVGHANVVLCAHAYLRAVKQLLHYCNSQPEYAQLPWLVNTMGYNKGFGLELIAAISELLLPTDMVQLQSNKEINNFDVILHPELLAAVPRNIYISEEFRSTTAPLLQFQLHLLGAAVPQESRYQKEWDMSPKDLRYSMMLARLSDALQGNAEWLTDCKPLSASLDCLKLVNTRSSEGTQEEVLLAIEANLVYLCHWETANLPLECFGVGVVRGVDHHIRQVYILPAMPYTRMSSVNCLAIGEMPLPTSMFTNQGPKVHSVAPFVYNTVNESASKAIKQIYHRSPKFLTSKRRNLL